MQLQAFLWLFLPVFVAGGSALLSYYIMQSRMEVALAKERESLAEARAVISSHKATMEERIKATEEATRRAALDELMQDIRLEERSYVRDLNTPGGARRSMVMQERVFFRNLPMSGWTEREMLIEEGPANSLAPRAENFETAVFAPPAPAAALPETRFPLSKTPTNTLDPVVHHPTPPPPAPRREPRTLIAAHAAFGAQ